MPRCEGATGFGWKEYHEPEEGAADHLCKACREKMVATEAANPRTSWQLYALHRGDHFEHFYGSTMQCTMCGDEPIALVELTLDDNGPYWGWYNSHHPSNHGHGGQISMIYRAEVQVRVCFAYGVEAEVRRGRGRMVRLTVKKIRDATHPEGIRSR